MATAFGGDGEQVEFPECPVCMEIPLGEIFQCPNRHIICGECASKPEIQACPLCRASLARKQRNLEMEATLDGMLIPCRNSSGGCTLLLQRHGMEEHLEHHCQFGNRIPICKLLGFRCKFKLDPSNMRPAIQHCILEHSFGPTQQQQEEEAAIGYVNAVHQKFYEFPPALMFVEMGWAFFYNFSGREDAPELGPLALIFSSTSMPDRNLNTRCFILGDNSGGNELEARVCFRTKEHGGQWTWETVPSVRITSATSDIKNSPAISVPLEAIQFMADYMNELFIQLARKETPMPALAPNNCGLALLNPVPIGDFIDNDDVNCKGCFRPLSLFRFKCLNCRKYDICMSCLTRKVHYPHVFALLVGHSQEEFILRVERETPGRKGIIPGMTGKEAWQTAEKDKEVSKPYASKCARCLAEIEKYMYSCLSCADFNLCVSCLPKVNHDRNHIFAVILSNSQEDFMASRRRQTRPILLPLEAQ